MRRDHDSTAPHPRRAWAAVGAVALAVIAAGCSGAAARTATSTSPQAVAIGGGGSQSTVVAAVDGTVTDASACDLLSEADVSTAMKQQMRISGGAGAAICTYSAAADPSIVLAVQSFADHPGMYTQLEPSSEHIGGLGDDAFWNPTLDMVFVQKGDGAFAVTSPSFANLVGDPQGSKSAMVDLARIVLGRS
jgi:hypothetical protein